MCNNNKYKKIFPILVIILIGMIFISSSSQLNEHIDGDIKHIDFYCDLDCTSSNQTINISFYHWKHDFTNNNGEILFKTNFSNGKTLFKEDNQKINVNNIGFSFSSPIEMNNVYYTNASESYIKKAVYKNNFDYILFGKETIVQYNNLLKNIKTREYGYCLMESLNSETIIVKYESTFEPDGTFIISSSNNINMNVGLGKHSRGNINFILGNNYILNKLTTLNNIEEVHESSDTNVSLTISEFYNDNPNKRIIFRLNSINKKISEDKALYMGLGISFLSSGIIMLFKEMTKPTFPSSCLFILREHDKIIKLRIKCIWNSIYSCLKGLLNFILSCVKGLR